MQPIKLLNACVFALNQIPNTRLSGEYKNTYALAKAIDEAKGDIKLIDPDVTAPPPSFILCYTLKSEKRTLNGNKSIVSDRTRTIFKDHCLIFTDPTSNGETPEQQAKKMLNDLLLKYDKENSRVELYTWNIARITESNDHYPL